KLRPPGPMILGAQAPGKVGHRQVNKQKTISGNEIVFLCCLELEQSPLPGVPPARSTLQEYALKVAVWRKAHLRHEVFLWGGWLGETLHWRVSCLSYLEHGS
ncbi:MAG: hypothetical protein P4L49_13430, partial [Desulfosporosinus sp.]|nr:hypothetical protein [Desulfosporosinus sp.]